MQRLPRIHSHIRGLFWTSKPFLLASTCKPPLITQLPVCTGHLSECVYVWFYIIVIQYQLRHSNVIMSKKRNALRLRHKVVLINEAESGKSCRVGRTHSSIDQRTSTYQFVQLRHLVTMTSHKTFHSSIDQRND